MNLEERITRLERQNRNWRFLALGLAGLMGFWLSCTAEIEPKSAPALIRNKIRVFYDSRLL